MANTKLSALTAATVLAATDLLYAAVSGASRKATALVLTKSLLLGRSAKMYGVTGDGVTNDFANLQTAVNAIGANGGILLLPAGDYVCASRLQVPAGVKLVGESIASTRFFGPGVDLNGDGCQLEGIQFMGSDTTLCLIKTNNVNHSVVTGCLFNRAAMMFSNSTNTDLTGARISDCYFTGNYLPWAATVNLIEVRGINNVQILNNRLLDVTNTYRYLKLQASIYYLSGEVLGQYCNGVVVSGNIITGTMSSGKQVMDMFDGCGRAVITDNIVLIESSGSGFSTFIEQKTGDGVGLQSPWASELLIADNVLVGAPVYAPVMITGAYSLAWEGEEQAVTIARNQMKLDATTGSLVGIEVRGMHRATIVDNEMQVENYGAIYRAISAANCKALNFATNNFQAGLVLVWGGSTTTTGDPYTGATKEISVIGNVLENFRSDHGGVELSGLAGTPSLVCIGNHLNSDVASATLALVYINNCAMTAVTCVGNIGDCGQANRNRLLTAGTTTITVLHEYFNSWQTKVVLEYDASLSRVTIGDDSSKVDTFYRIANAQVEATYRYFNAVLRSVETWSATAWNVNAYDTSGVLIDVAMNFNLNAGGVCTFNRPVDTKGRVRPVDDNLYDLGSSTLRWKSLYLQGGQTCGVSTVKTGTFSPTDDEFLILVDCSGGNAIMNLVAGSAARNGRRFRIRRIDGSGNTLTVNRAGSDTILDGSTSVTSFTIAGGATAELIWENANTRWIKL